MTNRRTPASSAVSTFARTARTARRVDDDVGPHDRRPVVPVERRPADDRDAFPALAGRGRDGPAEGAVAKDDRLHLRGPHVWWDLGRVRRTDTKTAVTVVVPRPLEPPFPGGPGSSSWTRRQSPRARASRQGRQSFFFDSSEKWRFIPGTLRIFWNRCNHYRIRFRGGGLGGRTLTLPPTASIMRPDASDPFPPRRSRR